MPARPKNRIKRITLAIVNKFRHSRVREPLNRVDIATGADKRTFRMYYDAFPSACKLERSQHGNNVPDVEDLELCADRGEALQTILTNEGQREALNNLFEIIAEDRSTDNPCIEAAIITAFADLRRVLRQAMLDGLWAKDVLAAKRISEAERTLKEKQNA